MGSPISPGFGGNGFPDAPHGAARAHGKGQAKIANSQGKGLDASRREGHNCTVFADVAELADAQASGACGLYARVGSTPIIRIVVNALMEAI